MEKLIREKHHRLSAHLYRGYKVVSFTACVKNRTTFFTKEDRFKTFEELLVSALHQFECGAEIYLFMPDHAHLLLRGESETADVLRAMRMFKQKTGFWLSHNHPSVHWQKDFYDHIVRRDAEVGKHIRYILNNPVRAELVNNWSEYRFKGSTMYKLNEWDFV